MVAQKESLSKKLARLAHPQKVSQQWMAHECYKLVPEAVRLEEALLARGPVAFCAGAILTVIVISLF